MAVDLGKKPAAMNEDTTRIATEEAADMTAIHASTDENLSDTPVETKNSKECHPICAKYEPEKRAFWLSRKRGKSISSGGFGIVLPKVVEAQPPNEEGGDDSITANDINDMETTGKDEKATTTISEDYLLIEEVLYLYERGVLEALDENEAQMDARQLYSMLNNPPQQGGMSMPVYLAYAHLRQQSFRVVRHSAERTKILLAMIQEKEECERRKAMELEKESPATDQDSKQENQTDCEQVSKDSKPPVVNLKRKLREASARATPPALSDSDNVSSPSLAWDVYPPDQNFARADPGLPAFSVLVTSYNHGTVSFGCIFQCITDNQSIPIKIATVSDSGIVILFGVTSEGIPSISASS